MSQANGSTPFSFAVATRLATIAQWRAPPSEPAKRAFFLPRAPTISNRIRLSTYPSRTRLAPREAKALANFRRGVADEVVLSWSGKVVSLAVPTLGAKAGQSWSNLALKVPATGARLMFYASFGGDFLVENVRLPS